MMRVLSLLSHKVQPDADGKTIIVHVERVKNMNLQDEGVISNFDYLSLEP